jgi:hypothetical protein
VHASLSGQPLFPQNHQVGKVDFELVGRCIRTVIKTELAIVAFVDDPAMILRRQLRHVSLVPVDTIEERVE